LSNTQRKLFNVRPPRVRILYEVEVGGALEERELPFVIGVISSLSGNAQTNLELNTFITIDRDNFDQVMESISPCISLVLANFLSNKPDAKLDLTLTFKRLNDFTPDRILGQIPEFQTLIQDRTSLIDLIPKLIRNQELNKQLIDLAKSGKLDPNRSISIANLLNLEDKTRRIEMINAFNRHVKGDQDLQLMIAKAILEIDNILSKQINHILHVPEFQNLEAKWRSLFNLVSKTETSKLLIIKVLNCSSDVLYDDLKNAPEFDQSRVFKLVYEEEYGTIGGIPFSCLILDEYFDKSSHDVHFLSMLSHIAAAAHAPLLVGVKPGMFELNSFSELHIPRELVRIFQTSDSIEWNSFRETEDARYVNMFLPNVLLRAPYNNCSKLFHFVEDVLGNDMTHFVWGNPAYCMALKIAEAVTKYGWAAAVRGTEGGGLVEGLPTYTFRNQFADITMTCPTQIHITDRREKELSDLGFISLCHKKMTNQAIFFSGQTVQNPKKYQDQDANTNAIISARMPYILNASRFIHYIKVIIRDKIGSFQTPDEIEYLVQEWIARYVLLSDDADQATKAKYPLREALVSVADTTRPGEYDITIRLRPHFQLEAANISVRFVGKALST